MGDGAFRTESADRKGETQKKQNFLGKGKKNGEYVKRIERAAAEKKALSNLTERACTKGKTPKEQ
jgi:hypothetical protein